MIETSSLRITPLLTTTLLLAACTTRQADRTESGLIESAQHFHALVGQQRYEDARAMMSEEPRRWFEVVEGDGMPWSLGPGTGPWAAWDEHFRSRNEQLRWRADVPQRSATLLVRETNDYYRLLDRGWSLVETTYLFDDADHVRGLLVHGIGPRNMGRTSDFLQWAREHEPEELAYLRPDGRIDPTGDRPARHRALLNRWRASVNLPALEPQSGESE